MKQRAETSDVRFQNPKDSTSDLVLFDLVEIERAKQIKVIKALLTDCKQIRRELEALD